MRLHTTFIFAKKQFFSERKNLTILKGNRVVRGKNGGDANENANNERMVIIQHVNQGMPLLRKGKPFYLIAACYCFQRARRL